MTTTTRTYRCPCGCAAENTTPRVDPADHAVAIVARLVTETEDHEEDHEVLRIDGRGPGHDHDDSDDNRTGHSARGDPAKRCRTHIAVAATRADSLRSDCRHEHSVYARDAAMRRGRDDHRRTRP